ncbi:MAG: c-type cytochrome [Vicinamibacterales bacterium]|nr:c-type cytochrome [Vicinamibacterales bacterium]
MRIPCSPGILLMIVCAGSPVLLARQNPTLQGHPEDYVRADIEYGARVFTEQCAACHGETGDGVAGVNLRSGKFKNAVTDPQLRTVITTGFPAAGMPAFTLTPSELTGLIAYLRNMNTFDRGSSMAGDSTRGRTIFDGKGACLSCHRVNNVGSRKAPDLSDIGANRSAGSLERSLRDPSRQMFPINRPVHIVTRDGKVINGRRLNEDTFTIQLADEEGRLISVSRADLREYRVSTTSTMPSYEKELSAQELADVVSFLLSLKGQ